MFKKLLKDIHEKNGYCSLMPRHYATISGKRTCCSSGREIDEPQPYIIENYSGTDRPVFRLLVGSTGWESWYVEDLLKDPCEDWFAACCGTHGRWDRLMVNGAEILEILRGCGYGS